MKTLKDLPDLSGKTVFVRVDYNVPVQNGVVIDDFRIKKSFTTIDELLKRGAKLILASHIEPGATLKPVFDYLKGKYNIAFLEDYYPNELDKSALKEITLLENLRKYKEEKENNEDFAKHLASLADYYVNEAFSSSHRSHASIVGIPKFIPGFIGTVFEEEIKGLTHALSPEHPFFFALGGAKFETKFPLAQKFFSLADKVFIGGALANDFLRAKGLTTGKSLVSSEKLDLNSFFTDKLILPVDVVVKNNSVREVKAIDKILPDDIIVDVGPESVKIASQEMSGSKCILWNGPLGNYENGFKEGTQSFAKAVAEVGGHSIVGGGDTVASISELNLSEKFTFISTGGGAMLDFLANETLPGIEALK